VSRRGRINKKARIQRAFLLVLLVGYAVA